MHFSLSWIAGSFQTLLQTRKVMPYKHNPARRKRITEGIRLITEVEIPAYPFRLDHHSPVLLMGSCFTDEMGRLLERYLFPLCINPFGVTYNPISLLGELKALREKARYTQDDLDYRDGFWFSFDHYTRFSHPDREKALRGINEKFLAAKECLENAPLLILTWGTAWVYRHKEKDRIVNNCHKIPAGEFDRHRLTPGQITEPYEEEFSMLFERHPAMKVLLTVSPVRHLKDTAHGNQLSKGTLLLAAEQLTSKFPDRCFYFPSYEIVMDELRDYRFYGTDLVHPGEIATRYIWEKFAPALIDEDSLELIPQLEAILRMKEHRPIHQGGTAHQKMVDQMEQRISELQKKYPHLAWSRWE